ncbi:MAG TPA: hypothetical protein VN903_26325 [Polyangia bacterium]|jgi:hypothetical protein|nr:hypothetical protein [Polyangia bacterium]
MARLAGILGAAALAAASCGATVEMRPGGAAYAPTIATIVQMPAAIDWTGPGAQPRMQRVAADSLIELTGGRVVIADELPGTGDSDVQAAMRALGEDAANALTFSLGVGIGRRLVGGANPIQSFNPTKRLVVDYVARVEVRHVGAPDIIGTVEAIESGPLNETESEHGRGDKWTAAVAVDEALEEAVRTFAPRIYTPRRRTLIVEVPPVAAGDLVTKLETLQRLYPELSLAEMQALADSHERFLVVEPGHLAALGVAPGDLLGVPGGTTRASRAALARAVARGGKPLVAVVRGGQRYILGI